MNITEHYLKKRKSQFILMPFMIIAVIPLVLWRFDALSWIDFFPTEISVSVSIIALGAGWIYRLMDWRCPACNKGLESNINPTFCPKCGVCLNDKSVESVA